MQRRALDLAIQAARGLMYSHEKGLIHQDMKPGNLLLSAEWEARVADFGLEVSTVNTEQEYCFRSPKYVIKDYVRDLQICSHQQVNTLEIWVKNKLEFSPETDGIIYFG